MNRYDVYLLGKSYAGYCPLEIAYSYDMKRLQTARVPNPHVRLKCLNNNVLM